MQIAYDCIKKIKKICSKNKNKNFNKLLLDFLYFFFSIPSCCSSVVLLLQIKNKNASLLLILFC